MPVDVTRCANCGIELEDAAEERTAPRGRAPEAEKPRYCCDGCAEGGPCTC